MVVNNRALQNRIDELIENSVFSEPEARILAFKEDGYSHAEIAEKLDLSQNTVNEYARRVSQRQQNIRETLDRLDNPGDRYSEISIEQSLWGFDIDPSGRRQLFLCPTANDQARKHFNQTVLEGVNVENYRELIPSQFDGTIAIWGTGTNAGTKVKRGDVLAFYVGDRTYSHIAVVQYAETNEDLNEALWTPYQGTLKNDSNASWPHVFYLSEPVEVNVESPVLHGDLDYDTEYPLGFLRVADVDDLYSKYGGLEQYFLQAKATASGEDSDQPTVDMSRESLVGPSRETATAADTEEKEASSDIDLDELRELAERASQETTTATTTTTTRRQRSQPVKDYALARADGICEGCGTEAPFFTAAGKPYLEIHHVFQVSDDGADSPDSVVALCPTCHRRVHHAHDGNEYNDNLIEKLQTDIEPDA